MILQCPNCKNTQEKGKFCGKCGTAMEEVKEVPVEEVTSAETVENEQRDDDQTDTTEDIPVVQENAEAEVDIPVVQENAETEVASSVAPDLADSPQLQAANQAQTKTQEKADLKQEAGRYWSYALELLKNPTKAFQKNEDVFLFGSITVLLYSLTFALAIYYAVHGFIKSSIGMFADAMGVSASLPFFDIFIPAFLIILSLLATSFVSMLIFEKTLIKQMSVKQIITQYGSLLTPFIAVHILALLTGLAGSIIITTILLAVSLLCSTFVMATLFTYEKIMYYRTNSQKVYSGLGVLLTNIVLAYFVVRITIIKLISNFMDSIPFDYF